MENKDLYGVNMCLDSGLLTATGAETVYDTTVVIPVMINGKIYRKAAVTDGASPTTDGVTGDAITLTYDSGTAAYGQGTVVVWCMNISGTVSVVKGETHSLNAAGAFIVAPEFPTIPDTLAPFAYMIIKYNVTSASTFTFGTSNWNATGTTLTIVNVGVLPDRPQIA